MCGISGIYNRFDRDIDSKKIIKSIIKLQNKRGPDDSGMWESNCKKVTLGHNRLSIIDTSNNAAQPMTSINDDLVITYNGEIYNYKEIRNELSNKTIKFKSNSDTEVILESYRYWGMNFLNKLRGMFAFAIWDKKNEKLILARDPFGIKPLYYSKKNSIFYFASSVKSLLSIEDISNKKNSAGIVNYYLWGNMQDHDTIYNDIISLKKGNYLIIDKNNKAIEVEHANLKEEIIKGESLKFSNKNHAKEYLSEIINETVKYHEVSDVPISLLLSSGVDSSVIAASINDKDKVNTLTLDFNYNDKNLNEVFLAKKTSSINKLNHTSEKISEDEISYLLNSYYQKMDQPTNDGFNNFLISYIVKKKNSKVMISGVGGDELFQGYPSFKRIPKINNLMQFIPNVKMLDKFFKSKLLNFLKRKKLNTKLSGVYSYGRKLEDSFLLQRSLFLPEEIKEYVHEEIFNEGWKELNVFDKLEKDIFGINDKKLSIMYLEINYYLCSKLLRDADWTSMSHSIEMRTPFVDFSFFKKLIPLLKSNINIDKNILLNCVKDKVPKELFYRKKTGFKIPHANYLKKVNYGKFIYSNPIKDWSIENYKHFNKDN